MARGYLTTHFVSYMSGRTIALQVAMSPMLGLSPVQLA
jgi:hypothetical protein